MKNNVGTWQKADASNPHSDASNKQHVTNILSECLFLPTALTAFYLNLKVIRVLLGDGKIAPCRMFVP
jgi:hypothetical protein